MSRTRSILHASAALIALSAMIVLSPVAAAPAAAAERSVDAVVTVSIPASELGQALSAFSRATGYQVIADPSMLAGKRSGGVTGTMPLGDALSRLFTGTGLDFTLSDDSILVQPRLAAAPAATTAARPGLPTRPGDTALKPDVPVLEEIIVTGFRGSLDRALSIKREADSVVDAISAEDIGKFPSQNIAEALQRVPGVSIVRDRGEGLFVRVRGLGPNFQTTTLNGRSAAVNENVRDSGQSGRQFRFDTLPAELVARVDVIKSPTAALDEGAIGGIVDVRTFRPLDLGRTTFAGSATASYAELADKYNPRVSGLVSWVDEDKRLGLLVSAVYDERSTRQDRILNSGWRTQDLDVDGDGAADAEDVLLSPGLRPTLELEDRQRKGVTAAAQWNSGTGFDLNLDVAYTELDIAYDELTYSADFQSRTIADPSQPDGGNGTSVLDLVPGTAVLENGVLVGGTAVTRTQIGRESSDLFHENLSLGLAASYEVDDWLFGVDLAYARAYSDTPNPIRRSRLLGPVGNVEFNYAKAGDAVPDLTFLDADLNQPDTLPGRRLEWRVNDSLDLEKAAQFDVTRMLDAGFLSAVRAGVKYRERSRDYDRRDVNVTTGIAGNFFGSEYFEPFLVDGFLGDVGGTLPREWLAPLADRFFELADPAAFAGEPTRGDLRNSYRIDEDITAGYVMGDLDGMVFGLPARGNLGVRVAYTEQTSSGHAELGTMAVPVSFEKTYTDVLPSANGVVELQDDLLLRMAVAKVITRPSLADLAPRLTLNSSGTILTAVGGNPELKPFEAWQYDATLEWYFGEAGALVAGVFYKDIGTFLTTRTSDLVVDGVTYELQSKVNGGEASIFGVELAWQQTFDFLPPPFDGLGGLANYTYTSTDATYYDGTVTIKDDLENVAKHSFNLTAFYEKGPIGLRVGYSWRGDVLQEVGTNGLASSNDKSFGTLDASASYQITDEISVIAEAMNLTNEAQWQYVRDGRFTNYTHYGRTYQVGLRAKF